MQLKVLTAWQPDGGIGIKHYFRNHYITPFRPRKQYIINNGIGAITRHITHTGNTQTVMCFIFQCHVKLKQVSITIRTNLFRYKITWHQ